MFKKISVNKISLIQNEIEIKKILNRYFLKHLKEDFDEFIIFKNFSNNTLSLIIKEPTLAQYINLDKKNILNLLNKKFEISDIKIKVGN